MYRKPESKGRTFDLLHVRVTSSRNRHGRLVGDGIDLAAAIGRSGLTALKREGDGASPIGQFRIVGGYYRPDRFPTRPVAGLPLRPLRPEDGWCDAPGDRNYNRPVRRPYPASHEAMWRDDGVYDIVLVLDVNLMPRVKGGGSAIFFHLARPDFGPTAGCLAIRRRDMLRLLPRLSTETVVAFGE
jgi:L,D-peptidoglycan transpeptidase YkuD (ErfK/YbiS/YcfS/YnhG family)